MINVACKRLGWEERVQGKRKRPLFSFHHEELPIASKAAYVCSRVEGELPIVQKLDLAPKPFHRRRTNESRRRTYWLDNHVCLQDGT